MKRVFEIINNAVFWDLYSYSLDLIIMGTDIGTHCGLTFGLIGD